MHTNRRLLLSRDQPIITTYHEAGHAVMAMANGFTVTRITNVSSDVGQGHVIWQTPDPPTTASRIGSILVFASGMAADFIHWQQNGTDEHEVSLGHQDDRRQAGIHLRELGEDSQFDVYLGIAIHFLRRHDVWEWVEGFADLMTAAGTIDGQQLIHRAFLKVPKIGSAELDHLKLALDMSKRGLL
ncbi:hypothetical protein GFM13_06415 [Rhizobium leguminosarum bv. viciae]|nr:hypothetical protein [Rhizobium leguminosarum bv. viciae]